MGLLMLLLPITSLVSFIGYIWLVRNAFRTSTGWGLGVLFLSPFSAVIYAVKFWDESRKPFLVYSGSVAAGMGIMVMMFATMGGFQAMSLANDMRNGEVTDAQAADFMKGQMDRMENSGMLNEQEKRDLAQMRGVLDDMTNAQNPAGENASEDMNGEMTENSDTPRPQITEYVEKVDPNASTSALVQALRMRAQESARESQPRPAGPIRVRDAKRYIGRTVTAMGTDGIEHTGILASSEGNSLWLKQYFTGGTFAVEVKKTQVRSMRVHGD